MISAIFKTFLLSLCIVANTHLAYAQTASILPPAKTQFLDNNGKPLTSGTVDFYIPSTTTRKTTWQNSAETIANANPVVLDAGGRAIIYGDGSYRQVVKDRNGNIIWDQVTSSTGSGSSSPTATGDGDLVGTIKPWAGMTAPNQYAFTYGQEVSRTTYATLFTAITSSQAVFCNSGSPILNGLSSTTNFWIGMAVEVSCLAAGNSTVISKTASTITLAANANVTTNVTATMFPWGRGNGSTTFNLPDFRGVPIAGNNNMGGVASSNLTTTYFGATDPNSIGALGGSQSTTFAQANLPIVNFTVASGQTVSATSTGLSVFKSNGVVITTGPGVGATMDGVQPGTGSLATVSSTGTVTNTGTAASGGSGTPISRVLPIRTSNYIIKITPDTNSATASGVTSLGGMTGDIACGTGVTCTGNIISANTTFVDLSFVQTGTGAVSETLDRMYRDTTFYPEMFADTANTAVCGIADAGPAIQRAINAASALAAGPGTVQLKPCIYNVTTPIVATTGVRLVGDNVQGTFLSFNPTSANLIAYRVRNAGNIVHGGSIENVYFYTNDTTYKKTAIELEDISGFALKNVRIGGNTIGIAAFWGDAANTSIGLRLKGREFMEVANLNISADIPFQISKNPNASFAGADSDQGDFTGMHLVATPTNPNFLVDDDVSLTRNTWTNLHMAGGVDCIRWINTTGILPSDGNTFNGVACEQGNSATGYNYYLHGNALGGFIRATTLSGTQMWDNARNGATLRYIQKMPIVGSVLYQGIAPLQCIDADATVYGLSWVNGLWQSCSTASFTQELQVGASLEGGTVLPNWASYGPVPDGNTVNIGKGLTFPNAAGVVTVVAPATGTNPVLSWPSFSASRTIAASTNAAGSDALTRVDDTNVTVTLGGTPANALLAATSITMGWTGTLSVARGGTGLGSGTSGGIPYYNSTSTIASSALLAASEIVLGGGAGAAPATTTTGTGVVTAVASAVNTNGGLATQQTKTPTITDGSGAGLALTVVQEGFQIGNMVHQLIAVTYPATADVSAAQLNGLAVTVPNRSSAAQCWMTRQNSGFAIQIQPIINTANMLMFTAGGAVVTNVNLTAKTISFQCIYPAT